MTATEARAWPLAVHAAVTLYITAVNWFVQIDILAAEVVRRSPRWACTIIGGVLEQECSALFEGRAG